MQDKEICIVCNYPCHYGSTPCTFCNRSICDKWICAKGFLLTHIHNVCKLCQDNKRIQDEIKYLEIYNVEQQRILQLEIKNIQKRLINIVSTKSNKDHVYEYCSLCERTKTSVRYVCFICDEYRCADCTAYHRFNTCSLIYLCQICEAHPKFPYLLKEIEQLKLFVWKQINEQDTLNLKTVTKLKCELGYALI